MYHLKIFLALTAFLIYTLAGESQSIVRIDFGPSPLEVPGYAKVGGETTTTVTWHDEPDFDFERPGFAATRKSIWLDGVGGKTLDLEVGLPNGRWNIQLAFDAGTEMTSTMQLAIGGESRPLGWHTFRPQPVTNGSLTEHYRIWQGNAEVTGRSLRLTLTGGDDDVRLLSLEAVAEEEPSGGRENWIADLARDLGLWHNRNSSLATLKDELERLLAENPSNAWAYWMVLQVDLLERAERMYDLRGWEYVQRETHMSFIDRTQLGGMLLEPVLMVPQHPFEERARWLRARFLLHLNLQYGHPPELEQAMLDFGLLREKYPGEPLIRMYNGEKIPVSLDASSPVAHPEAPEWSSAQLLSLHKLRQLVYYWVLERQEANGELGGKWGDDVEALRFWLPLALTADSITRRGWQRMADGVWYSPQVNDGFARYVDDVEHSSEFISDTEPLMLLISDDEKYRERIAPTLEHFLNLWTGISPSGYRFFKSAWYSATEVDTRPPRNRDVHYNTRTLAPLKYLVFLSGKDRDVIEPLIEHAMGWTAIARRTDKGKPAGILPPSVRLEDESINGDESTWYEANMFWSYYDFSGSARLLDHLLFLWQVSDEDSLLYPLHATLDLVRKHADSGFDGPAGSAAWAAAHYARSPGFWRVVGQWRWLTGDTRYDDLLAENSSPYLDFLLRSEVGELLQGLEEFDESIGYNWPLLTDEVMFTDRILATNRPGHRGPRVNPDILTSMLTGDIAVTGETPYYQVTWDDTFDGFTGLVEDFSDSHLTVSIFNHSATDENAQLRAWGLKSGQYQLSVGNGKPEEITIDSPGKSIRIFCPAGELSQLIIQKK